MRPRIWSPVVHWVENPKVDVAELDQILSRHAGIRVPQCALAWKMLVNKVLGIPEIMSSDARLPVGLCRSHNPKVAGSNPAPATNPWPHWLVAGGAFGLRDPFHPLCRDLVQNLRRRSRAPPRCAFQTHATVRSMLIAARHATVPAVYNSIRGAPEKAPNALVRLLHAAFV